ncbi:MAG: response regulator transcription factor [Planctomycetes bacterium]|nr:response regulator transcription factor [Planctomycetota bacterium]
MARILLVEDERKILRSLERGFKAAGYDVASAANGQAAFQDASRGAFDCIVLDVMLPGMNGMDVLAEFRNAGKSTPVLLLTARDAVEDRVRGLETGADDYLVKPFAFAELLARVRALLRRDRADRETVLQARDLEMDLIERRVTRLGQDIGLTRREFDLLEYLLRHKNAIVSREMLGRDVWKEPNYALTNVIDVCINSLRRKIELQDTQPLLHTLRGLGYCLRDDPCA